MVPVIDGRAKLDEPLVQRVGDGVDSALDQHLRTTIVTLQVYNLSLGGGGGGGGGLVSHVIDTGISPECHMRVT